MDQFLTIPFVRQHHLPGVRLDSYHEIEWGLKLTTEVSFATLSRALRWIKSIFMQQPDERDSMYGSAASESAFQTRAARFIVYGHTHNHVILPLESSYRDGARFDQMYLNTGTWRRVQVQTEIQEEREQFMGYNVMTYFAFFHGDERGGRPFESWSGALGV